MPRFSPYKSQSSNRSNLYKNLVSQWKSNNPCTPFATYVTGLELEDPISIEEILEIERYLKTCIVCKTGILSRIGARVSCSSCLLVFDSHMPIEEWIDALVNVENSHSYSCPGKFLMLKFKENSLMIMILQRNAYIDIVMYVKE